MNFFNLEPPPMPKWYGFDTNLADRYARFLQTHLQTAADAAPDLIRSQLRGQEAYLPERRRSLAEARTAEAKAEAIVSEVRCLASSPPTDEALVTELEWLTTMPYVLGTRTDASGRLFVQFRITHVEGEGRYDFGDYELGLATVGYSGDNVYVLNLIRRPDGLSYYLPFREADPIENGGVFEGRITIAGYHLRTGRLVGLLEVVMASIASRVRQNSRIASFRLGEGSQPDQLWEGAVTNLLKAYKRSVALMPTFVPRIALREVEHQYQTAKARAEAALITVRETQTKIRSLRAELRHAEAVKNQTISVSSEEALQDFDYIAALPGVMGIRIGKDGIPVIHVRATHVFRGRRYDLGDFEVYLTTSERNQEYGVVKIRATRWQKDGGLYLTSPGTGSDWFCFGTRAGMLRGHFERGRIREFLHMAVNSLNGINQGDRSEMRMQRRYQEIPMSAVWKKRPKKNRKRRRPRASTVDATTAA